MMASRLVVWMACISVTVTAGARPQPLFADSPTHFFVLDGPQELRFDTNGRKVESVEFITPMNHGVVLKKSEEYRK